MKGVRPRPLAERFWAKVERRGEDECWPWRGAVSKRNGYGKIRDEQGRVITASHAALIVDGRDPGDLYALHSCDNPACVNPRHLRAGTNGENVSDAVERGRHRHGFPVTLDAQAARRIRRRVRAGELQRDLAAEYGVSQPTISDVIRGKTWTR